MMNNQLSVASKDENQSLKNTITGLEETWGIIIGNLVKGVVKNFGEKGRKVIRESMIESGLSIGNQYIKSKSIKKKDLKGFAKYFNDISDVEVFNIKVDVADEEKFTFRTENCPYLKYWKELGIDKEVPDFCYFTTSADLGIARAFDKKIGFKLKKNMLAGDDCCVYSFEKK